MRGPCAREAQPRAFARTPSPPKTPPHRWEASWDTAGASLGPWPGSNIGAWRSEEDNRPAVSCGTSTKILRSAWNHVFRSSRHPLGPHQAPCAPLLDPFGSRLESLLQHGPPFGFPWLRFCSRLRSQITRAMAQAGQGQGQDSTFGPSALDLCCVRLCCHTVQPCFRLILLDL